MRVYKDKRTREYTLDQARIRCSKIKIHKTTIKDSYFCYCKNNVNKFLRKDGTITGHNVRPEYDYYFENLFDLVRVYRENEHKIDEVV